MKPGNFQTRLFTPCFSLYFSDVFRLFGNRILTWNVLNINSTLLSWSTYEKVSKSFQNHLKHYSLIHDNNLFLRFFYHIFGFLKKTLLENFQQITCNPPLQTVFLKNSRLAVWVDKQCEKLFNVWKIGEASRGAKKNFSNKRCKISGCLLAPWKNPGTFDNSN